MLFKFRFLSVLFLFLLAFNAFSPFTVFAATTVLPSTSIETTSGCEYVMLQVSFNVEKVKEDVFLSRGTYSVGSAALNSSDILGCAIKTGNISLWMIPYFIRYLLEFVLGLSGLIAVAGIVYGGFLYLFAGISDDKEKGKKALLYGVVGFGITMVAFAFVNIVIALVTG